MKLIFALLTFTLVSALARAQGDEGSSEDREPAKPLLDQEMRERLRKVMRDANQQPQVVTARQEARSAGEELSKKIRELAGKREPEIAEKLDKLGFEWMPRRGFGPLGGRPPEKGDNEEGRPHRHPPGAGPGPPPFVRKRGAGTGPRGIRNNKDLALLRTLKAEERRKFRRMIRGVMKDPELRPLRRQADRKWRRFKKALRSEAEKIDPEAMKALEDLRPFRDRPRRLPRY